jgi:phage gp29-like protein
LRTVFRQLGSLIASGEPPARPNDRVIRPWRDDAVHAYPTVGITPARVLAMLQAADSGSPQLQFELFDEMLQKWPRLAAVEGTRRLALTGLDWEIAAESGSPRADADDRLSREAADFCRAALSRLDRFPETLTHLARAIGRGIAVAELVWEDGTLIDIVPVPYSRLVSDANEPWRLRVLTQESPSRGVALDEQPFKWLVHQPMATPGRNFESGVLRASALLYIAQNLSFKDWLIYSQIAGMPIRVARFEPGMPEGEKQKLLKMLEALGTDAVAAISKNVELEMVESGTRSDKPYKPLQDYCNREITILWLGQHLTTDISGQGSRAAAEIHDRVREDLLVNDMADESRTIRGQLLSRLVQAKFGDGVLAPRFQRSLIQSVDTKVLADTLAVAVRELGMRVPTRWVHRAMGIPEPAGDEPVLAIGGAA